MSATAVDAAPLIDDDLLQQINTWCGVHGLMYSDGGTKWNAAPLSLTPLPYPTEAFAFLRQMQPVWNYLMDSVARNRSFLLSELKDVAESDEEFTGTLYKLFRALPESQVRDAWAFGVFRSDYMLSPSPAPESHGFVPMQVEINTIASGLGCLSTKAGHFLRDFLLRHASHPQLQRIFAAQEAIPSSAKLANTTELIQHIAHALQVSPSLRKIAAAMAQAHEVYVRRLRSRAGNGDLDAPDALHDRIRVLFVVQPRERNVGDQRALEEELWRRHSVRCEFATFAELSRWLQIDGDGGGNDNDAPTLFLQRGPDRARYEVSLVYFRAGYTPADYAAAESHGECAASLAAELAEPSRDADLHRLLSGNAAWRVRWAIERSRAIKCPSLGLHLAGTKAVQAAVAREGVLEALLAEASRDDAWAARAAALLRRCFAEQHLLSTALEAPSGAGRGGPSAAIDAALACDGRDWVLKPQREGGGNNLYRAALADALRAARGAASADLQGKGRAAPCASVAALTRLSLPRAPCLQASCSCGASSRRCSAARSSTNSARRCPARRCPSWASSAPSSAAGRALRRASTSPPRRPSAETRLFPAKATTRRSTAATRATCCARRAPRSTRAAWRPASRCSTRCSSSPTATSPPPSSPARKSRQASPPFTLHRCVS